MKSIVYCTPLFLILSSLLAGGSPTGEEELEEIGWTTCQSQHLTSYFQHIASNYSAITRLLSIGKSVEGNDLWVLIISDSPNKRPLMRPQVKFVGNINGFSGPSCYVLLRLIKHLVEGYHRENSLERKLIQSNEIHILPNMNPDGFRRSAPGICDRGQGRYNAGGRDLNRDFPDIFNPLGHNEQPETKAIMKWIETNNFVISMSYITGAHVVSYPFDAIPFDPLYTPEKNKPHLCPDHNIFKHLASTYVQNVNANWSSTSPEELPWYCPALKREFPDGTVNGAEWMPVSGTMLDFNYVEGTFELLAGISCCRNENNEKTLERIWLNNKMAMLKMMEETEFGVRGQVVDSQTFEAIPGAVMRKLDLNYSPTGDVIPVPWRVSSKGEFWRPLLPGKYNLEVYMPGYKEVTVPVEVLLTPSKMIFIQLEKEEMTPLPPTYEDTPDPDNNESLKHLLSFEGSDGSEMGDQSMFEFEELFNETLRGIPFPPESIPESQENNSSETSTTTTSTSNPKKDLWQHTIIKLFGTKKNKGAKHDARLSLTFLLPFFRYQIQWL